MKTLRDLFLDELAKMHTCEKELTKALPLLKKAAKSEDLKTLLDIHLKETEGHVKCIEQVAESLQEELPDQSCPVITSLIKDAVVLVVKNLNSPWMDAAIIADGQKIEHYEIASYGTLCAWAKILGYKHERVLLISTLQQEKTADMLLAGLAKGAPLRQLVEAVSLKAAGAKVPPLSKLPK